MGCGQYCQTWPIFYSIWCWKNAPSISWNLVLASLRQLWQRRPPNMVGKSMRWRMSSHGWKRLKRTARLAGCRISMLSMRLWWRETLMEWQAIGFTTLRRFPKKNLTLFLLTAPLEFCQCTLRDAELCIQPGRF